MTFLPISQWEEQHRALSCEDFQSWKRENDAEYQAQGLAVYLQENGISKHTAFFCNKLFMNTTCRSVKSQKSDT